MTVLHQLGIESGRSSPSPPPSVSSPSKIPGRTPQNGVIALSSIFSLQHVARIEAQKAYVHLDCSRRVQRALTKNASVVPREFSMGDLVTFQRDNHRGHTSWSPTSRVIGHEGPKNLWLLCGNVPDSGCFTECEDCESIGSFGSGSSQMVIRLYQQTLSMMVGNIFLGCKKSCSSEQGRYGPVTGPSPSVLDDALPIWNEDLPPVPEEDDEELEPVEGSCRASIAPSSANCSSDMTEDIPLGALSRTH